MKNMGHTSRICVILSFALVLAVVGGGSRALAGDNLLPNSSFEQVGGRRVYEDRLLERGFDIGLAEEWPRSWVMNPSSMGPARMRAVLSDDAPDGERYIRVSDVEGSRAELFADGIYQSGSFRWSFWARGERTDGRDRAPELQIRTYDYGRGEDGARTFLGNRIHLPVLELSGEWKKYEGDIIMPSEDVVEIRFVFGFTPGSSVDIDDVAVIRIAAQD